MITRVFIWDWKDRIPYVEMLKYQHKNPNLHLYEYDDHGGTFTFLVFSLNKRLALKEVIKSFGKDNSFSHKTNLRKIF